MAGEKQSPIMLNGFTLSSQQSASISPLSLTILKPTYCLSTPQVTRRICQGFSSPHKQIITLLQLLLTLNWKTGSIQRELPSIPHTVVLSTCICASVFCLTSWLDWLPHVLPTEAVPYCAPDLIHCWLLSDFAPIIFSFLLFCSISGKLLFYTILISMET